MTSISIGRSLEAPRQLIGEAVASQPSAAARSKRRLPGALLTALIGAAVVCASMAAMAASDTAEARRAKASVAKASGGFYGGRTSPNPRVRQSYKRFMTERRQYKQHKKAAIRQTNRDAKRWTTAHNKAYSAGQNVAKQKRQHGANSRQYLAANRRFGRSVGNYIDANNAWNRHTRLAPRSKSGITVSCKPRRRPTIGQGGSRASYARLRPRRAPHIGRVRALLRPNSPHVRDAWQHEQR